MGETKTETLLYWSFIFMMSLTRCILMFAWSFLNWIETQEGTAKERTHLFIFIEFIRKIKEHNSEIADEKKWEYKAIEENNLTVTHNKKTFMRIKFILKTCVYRQKYW